jgi:hypothetical protein
MPSLEVSKPQRLPAAAMALVPAAFPARDAATTRGSQLLAAALSAVHGNSWHGGCAILDASPAPAAAPTPASAMETAAGVTCAAWLHAGRDEAALVLGTDLGDLVLWRPSGEGSAEGFDRFHQAGVTGVVAFDAAAEGSKGFRDPLSSLADSFFLSFLSFFLSLFLSFFLSCL